MDLKRITQRKFRPEIEGLRAVAAMLVAIYHIWLGSVSGGVDVFFVVSGFLITTSLLSRFEKNNKIGFFSFLLRLAKRLFPVAFSTMLVITVASIIWLPQIRWDQTVNEVFSSALYYQNWQLASDAVDYLAQNNEASPFQHYWALSVQGQFYIIWPFLLAVSAFLANRIFKKSIRFSFLITLISLFGLSLSYSIYKTSVNQPWAYFDTFARVWEFSMGGIVALLISRIVIRQSVSVILGWLGLVAILTCGIILQVSTVFPGYAALWPTLGAVFIIVVGTQGGTFGVHRLLSSKPLMKLGSISYAFYLWHWPVLIFYFVLTGKDEVPLLDGLIIILFSIIISYLSTFIIEKPIRSLKIPSTNWRIWFLVVSLMLPVLIVASFWSGIIKKSNAELMYAIEDNDYPGAMSLIDTDNVPSVEDVPVLPLPIQARNDLPKVYEDKCHQKSGKSEVIECEYGVSDHAKYTIALVGGSHSAHWLPALEAISELESIKIITYTKSGCRFTSSEEELEDCQEWNNKVIDVLMAKKPDLVFTTADVAGQPEVPEGFVKQWEKLNKAGIEVFAVRDNPRFGFDVASCVEEKGANSRDCSVEREKVLPAESAWSKLENPPENVHYVDLSDYFCEKNYCKAVIGNVLVYRDSGHITATYSRTMAPILRDELMPLLKR